MKRKRSILFGLLTVGILLPLALPLPAKADDSYYSVFSRCMDYYGDRHYCTEEANQASYRKRRIERTQECYFDRQGYRRCGYTHDRKVYRVRRKRKSPSFGKIFLRSLLNQLATRDNYYHHYNYEENYNRFISRYRYVGVFNPHRQYDDLCIIVVDDYGNYHVYQAYDRRHVLH